MPSKRKLSAILSMDVVGYSRLMQADERGTVADLRSCRQTVKDLIERHQGRVVNAPGDALLAECPSAVEAVAAAIEIQKTFELRNLDVTPDKRMQLRIGINLGDVIEEDDGTIYGDGVNIAARLESLAEPGGIRVSSVIRDAVEGKSGVHFEFAGEHQVKNIAKPVQTYRVGTRPAASTDRRTPSKFRKTPLIITTIVAGLAIVMGIVVWQKNQMAGTPSVQSTADPALAMPSGPAIAVLPLDNMSGDPKQEFFGDGIAEEIIAGLSQFPNLRVLARNSTFQYKGKSTDVRQIGKEIGANFVVEGSVRRSADTVRVTVQLLDATSGAHVWAETYERKLTPENLFAVQDDITSQVVTRIGDIHGAVNRAQIQKLRTKAPTKLEDYECILLAYEYQRFLTPDKHAATKTCLTQVVERNPSYAEAWANLAYVFTDQYWGEYQGPPDSLKRAFDAARHAVDLAPTSPMAHYALANVYFFRNDLEGFYSEADKALALNPHNTEILAALGVRFTYAEKRERGLAFIKKAITLNPAHPGWYLFPVAYHHFRNEDYRTALEYAQRIEMPGFWYMHLWLTAIYGQLGQDTEAKASLQRLLALNPAFEKDPMRYLRLWFKTEDAVEQWADGLRKAGMKIPTQTN